MRVQISNPGFLSELLAFLHECPDAVVEQVSENELEASLLDSRRPEALRTALELRLRAWQKAHPDVTVQVLARPERRGRRLWLI